MFGDIPVLLLEIYVFESFALNFVRLEEGKACTFTYEHRVEWLGNPTERGRVI